MKAINYLKQRKIHLLGIVILFLTFSCQNSHNLFQEDNKNWNSYGDANWKFSNNDLIGYIYEGAGYIITQQTYNDFVLELEFKPDSIINSGVFIRCKNEEISPTDCYEINIWDLHPNQDYRTGSIVMKSVPSVKVETNNKWNTLKISAKQNHIQVWINNISTVDLMDDTRTAGYIGLQASGQGEVKFRNIKIKPLKTD